MTKYTLKTKAGILLFLSDKGSWSCVDDKLLVRVTAPYREDSSDYDPDPYWTEVQRVSKLVNATILTPHVLPEYKKDVVY